ncbi:MAG: hypothetical protein ACLQU2_13215 [Candidatus Binataceae bacterium]
MAGGAIISAAALPVTPRSSLADASDSSARARPLLIRRNVTRLSAADKSELVKAVLEMKKARSPFDPSVSYYDQFARWHLLSLSCPIKDH